MTDFIWTIVIVLLLSPLLAYLYRLPKTKGIKAFLILGVSVLIFLLAYGLDKYVGLDLRRIAPLLVVMPLLLLLLTRITKELDKPK